MGLSNLSKSERHEHIVLWEIVRNLTTGTLYTDAFGNIRPVPTDNDAYWFLARMEHLQHKQRILATQSGNVT